MANSVRAMMVVLMVLLCAGAALAGYVQEWSSPINREWALNGPVIDTGMDCLDMNSDGVPELELESGEVTTVGGYITQQLGNLPKAGDTVEIEGFEAKVTSTDGRRVGQVHFRKVEAAESEDQKIEGAA